MARPRSGNKQPTLHDEAGPPQVDQPAAVEAVMSLAEAQHCRCMASSLDSIGDVTGALFERLHAERLEKRGNELLAVPDSVARTRGPGGELALGEYPDSSDGQIGWYLKDTLEDPDLVKVMASKNRMALALEISAGCLNGGLDASETIKARDGLERMAAFQMAAAHEAAMTSLALGLKTLEQSKLWGQQAAVEGCRLLNAATRLMNAYSVTLATLARVRTGGRQEVVVQHVNVAGGGQAVIAGSVIPPAAPGPAGEK